MSVKMKETFVVSYDKCTGCNACKLSCPKNCIEMEQNEEGFFYPYIDCDKCISCDMCRRICPELSPPIKSTPNSDCTFMALSKNVEQSILSSSGGAFAAIATWAIETKGAVIFGASLEPDFSVQTIGVDHVSDIRRIQGSKYVQCITGDSYRKVQSLLTEGRFVLYSGTPCQIAGLYAFLKKDYDKLLTIDIICHGVSSPGFFKKYIKETENATGRKLEKVTFRTKFFGNGRKSYFFMSHYFIDKSGHEKTKKAKLIRTENDVYFNIYLKGKGFRECCYNCQYACVERIGDITVGDCDSQIEYESGADVTNSTLILNSRKAKQFWKKMNRYFNYSPMDLAEETKRNHQLVHPFQRPNERNDVYRDLYSMNWEMFANKYSKRTTLADRCKVLIFECLPTSIYVWLIDQIARLKNTVRR